MGFLRDIFKSRAKDWIYAKLDSDQVPNGTVSEVVAPNEHYINVWLKSLRIVDVRKGFNTFYPVVHSYVSVPHLGSTKPVEFNMVTTPTNLEQLDAKRIDRVITLNKRMLGPLPYRGGDLELELGVFSIKSADLAGPYLTLIEDISSLAGVSFVGQALQFAEPLKKGINLLTGGNDDTILEVGLSTTYGVGSLQTGFYVVIRAEKTDLDPKRLKLDPKDFKLSYNGEKVKDYPYVVFEISTTQQKNDWYAIKELHESYEVLVAALKRDINEEIEECWKAFKRAVLICPDLIAKDRQNVIVNVENELISPLRNATPTSRERGQEIKSLREYNIYK